MTGQANKQFADVQQAQKETCGAAWSRLATRHDEIGALLKALPDTYVFEVTPLGEDQPVRVTAREFKDCYFGLQWSLAAQVAQNGGVGATDAQIDQDGKFIGGTTKILEVGLLGTTGDNGYDASPASRALLCLHETAHATSAGRASTQTCWTQHLAYEAGQPYDQTSGAWCKNERLANDIAKAVANVLPGPYAGPIAVAPNPIAGYSPDNLLVAIDTAQTPKAADLG
jgi:hypothetical protein